MSEGSDIDFETLVERVRTHSSEAPGSDTERIQVRSFDAVDVDALGELRAAVEAGSANRGALSFFVSEANADRLTADAGDVAAVERRLGHEVRVVDAVPDDTILLLDPEAVDDGEIRDPTAIAYGTVGKTT